MRPLQQLRLGNSQTPQTEFMILRTPSMTSLGSSTSSCLSNGSSPVSHTVTCDLSGRLRNDVLLVLRFDERAKYTYEGLTRSDVLQIIRHLEKSPNDTKHTDDLQTKPKRSGSVVSPMGAFCDLQPVHMRDLRQLDESFNASNETSIVVRKQAILINADPIRSIITRNATFVFVPDGADSLLLMLMKDFEDCVQRPTDASTAYEFKALEALLDTLSRVLDEEYETHAAEITDVLDSIVQVRMLSGELETMRLMKNSMNAFVAQVDSIRRALMDVLNNEEDLRLLYLTKGSCSVVTFICHLHEDPSLIYDLGSFDPEEVEILLESYLKGIYSTRTKSELLQHRIQTTESLIMMKLDYARNYLLALQLIFSLVGVGLGVGTLISGIFGMNLKIDGPTTSVQMFWWVIGIIMVGCVAVVWGGIAYFRRQGLTIGL